MLSKCERNVKINLNFFKNFGTRSENVFYVYKDQISGRAAYLCQSKNKADAAKINMELN